MDLLSHHARFTKRLSEVEAALSEGAAFADARRAAELAREHARVKATVERFAEYAEALRLSRDNESLRVQHQNEPEMLAMIEGEARDLAARRAALELILKAAILPPDPNDSRNTILEIRAGTGGDEAALFAADLFRMYTRFAESRGWKIETMDSSPSALGGLKEVVASVQGQDVYRHLRYESGVHRVQRIPATEAGGRIHTSTATVAVLPEAEEVDVEIRPDELEITVCRASGPGGQGVNTTDSAVQVLHKPTGVIVRCADERSQIKNKAKALRVLRSRLLTARQEEETAKASQARRSQIGTGDRSERIRTYNFPQNRVTDHRIGLTLHHLGEFIEGDIGAMIAELARQDLERRLADQDAKAV
ncbi:MAG: peptide chain release factor 1 [Verrucomicrobiae bacterium]|nr:peptide chain release factor 1 [Verrucomicrobiae bacterium]